MASERQTVNGGVVDTGTALATAGAAVFFRLARLVPNFNAVGGLGLFAGARLPLWQALALTGGVMALTDAILWMVFGWPGFDPFVYTAFAAYALLGRFFLRDHAGPVRVVGVSLLGSVQFFLLTNFGAWLMNPSAMYPRSPIGLVYSYWAAVPFFGYTAGSDLATVVVAFTAAALARRSVLAPSAEPVPGGE
jgi:hypothetical protein